MKTQSTVLDNASKEPSTPDRILQTALAAWRQGNLVEVVDQFSEQFTFAHHPLELEFKDKGRLTEFLAKIRELFPDSERKANTIFSNGDHVIGEAHGYVQRTFSGRRFANSANLRARRIGRADKERAN